MRPVLALDIVGQNWPPAVGLRRTAASGGPRVIDTAAKKRRERIILTGLWICRGRAPREEASPPLTRLRRVDQKGSPVRTVS